MSSKRKGLQRESSIFQSLSLQRQRLWTAPCLLQLDYLISLNVLGILPVGPSKPTGHFFLSSQYSLACLYCGVSQSEGAWDPRMWQCQC